MTIVAETRICSVVRDDAKMMTARAWVNGIHVDYSSGRRHPVTSISTDGVRNTRLENDARVCGCVLSDDGDDAVVGGQLCPLTISWVRGCEVVRNLKTGLESVTFATAFRATEIDGGEVLRPATAP